MLILIVGARGMLGTDLMEIIGRCQEVTGTDIEDFDITERQETLSTLLKIKPSWVINASAYTQVDRCETEREQAFKVNAEGVFNLALACKEIQAKLLHVSTDYVFDGNTKIPYREEELPNPLSVYGQSKLRGESLLQSVLDDFIIARTAGLYGKRGVNFVDTILKRSQERDELTVVNDQWLSPTYTVDLAEAIGTLVKHSARGIFHLANTGLCTWYQFACKILEITGSSTKVIPIGSNQLKRPAPRPVFSVLDCSKYTRITGRKMRPWEEALADYLSKRKIINGTTENTEGRKDKIL